MRKASLLKLPLIAASLAASALCAQAAILIDFGANGTPTGFDSVYGLQWNDVTLSNQPYAGRDAIALVDTANAATGVSLVVSNTATTGNSVNRGFDPTNSNSNGPIAGIPARFYPSSATRDSLLGYYNTGTLTQPTGDVILTFSGLSAGQEYDFFGLTSRSASGSRTAEFSFAGQNTLSTTSNAASGTGSAAPNLDVFSVSGVFADENGVISLTIRPIVAQNDTTEEYFYLNVLEIVPVPEPSSAALLGFAGVGLLFFRRRVR